MFLDADDYLADDAIKRLVDAQSENDADIVRFRYECVYTDGSVFVPDSQIHADAFVNKTSLKKKYIRCSSKAYILTVCVWLCIGTVL